MISESDSHHNPSQTNWLVVFLVVFFVAISLLPVVFHFPAPSAPGAGPIFIYLPAILAAVLCYVFDQVSTKKEKIHALLLSLVFAFAITYLHVWLVDLGQQFERVTNLQWQLHVQKSVIALRPDTLPHSYRFLPNSFVRLFEQVTGDFPIARDSYRNLFGVLLFYSFYRFARLFLQHRGSLVCLVLLAAILPVSFRNYAGQLTDPMSHLSFILAFIFIETEQFVYLLLTVTIGCLAKETIAAMAGYYALFCWREKSYIRKLTLLVLVPLAVCGIARIWVLHGVPNYRQISGVGVEHLIKNLKDWLVWLPGVLYTTGVFVPFVVAGWRKSPWTLRSLAIYWFPVLFFSSLFFSWLREARNFVPLAALLALLAVYQLLPGERTEATDN